MAQEEPQDDFVPATGVFVATVDADEAPEMAPYAYSQDPMALIGWPQISDELEIVDEQRKMIVKLQREMQEKMQQTMQNVMKRQKEGQPIDHRQIAERIEQLNKNIRARLNNDVLLPHQTDRLKQLALQMY